MEEINFGEDFSNEIQYEEKDKKYTVKIEFDNEVEAEECLRILKENGYNANMS